MIALKTAIVQKSRRIRGCLSNIVPKIEDLFPAELNHLCGGAGQFAKG